MRQEAVQQALAAMHDKPKQVVPLPSKRASVARPVSNVVSGDDEHEDFRICLLVNILIVLLPYHCTLCIEYFKAIKVHHHSDSILRQTFSKSKI